MTLFPPRLRWFAATLVAFAPSLSAQDLWQGQSIYQIVTDRFADGDAGNDNADGNFNAAAGQGVHGGDFKGIEQKLDYIKALGATAIWISPVVKNANGDYHGYAGSDFYNVDPHWGTLADLQHLIQTAHAKGILVIDDVVVNHGSQLLNSNDSGYPKFKTPPSGYNLFYRDNNKQYAAPFNPASGQALTSLFHNNGFIQDFNNTTQVENGFLEGLDDFRTENTYVQTNMASIYKFWLEQGFDGFRIDTVKHVNSGFWQTWCPQIHSDAASHAKPNFFMFGEIYDSSETKNASYTGTVSGPNFELDSVLDYPLFFSMNPVFAVANSNTKRIEDHYAAVDANYAASARMRLVTFLDNHDQPRFLNSANANNNTARLNMALAFLYTSRGIPSLYYGTEQAFNGGADPNDREDMFAGRFEQGPSLGDNFNETHALFQLVAKLNNFRRLYPALTGGSHVNLWNNPNGPGLFAYSRVLNSQEVFVVLNTASINQTLPSRSSTYPGGTVLVNLLNPGESITISSSRQTPSIKMTPTSAKIFLAQSQVGLLDPVITSVTPTHDAKNVPTPSNVVLQFSKPMDTASTEAAFSTVPATTGTFAWSQNKDQLTYQVTGGLPALTTVGVHLAATAVATDGTKLFAAFDSRFSTAVQTVVDVTPPTITITTPAAGAVITDNGDIEGHASDDKSVVTVQFSVDGGDWVSNSGIQGPSITWSHPFWMSNHLNGPHVVSARALDAAGNVSPVVTVPFTSRFVPGPFEQFFFGYGSSGWGIQDCSNQFWDSDNPFIDNFYYGGNGYVGGNTAHSSNAITNVCSAEQSLYEQERYSSSASDFKYLFNCPPGVYEVTILDAETFMTGPNQRRFDVYAQGQKVLPNFDIFSEAGGANLGITRTFTVNVANALLDVDFKPVFDNARVSAIHVKKVGDIYSDTDGIADWWRLAYFGHATGQADDASRAEDDSDGDGVTNLQEFYAQTNPTDGGSNLRMVSFSPAGNDIAFIFMAAYGVTYQLQRATDLVAADWADIGTPEQSFTNGQMYIWDTGGTSRSRPEFYRVAVVR